MNTRVVKKKPATSPLKPNNSKKKSKSKSKSKQKLKNFCAKDFLQALIDLQNTNCSTNKKKRNTTRDISSALTIATPALQKTISASKIRSKSSFSQYRKKINDKNKQPLTINLCAVITEQDNIQYTQKTARSNYQQQQNKKNKINVQKQINSKRLNENLCARKIQRAWRNYQTYKMVHKIYLKEKKVGGGKNKKQPSPSINHVHINIRKSDAEKILKIKKEHALRKQQRKQQQFSQTRKLIQERYSQKQQEESENMAKSPIQCFSSQSNQYVALTNPNEQQSNKQKILIQKIKQKQAERLNEVICLIQKQNKNKSKEQLINQLIQKFQENKRILEIDIQKQIKCIQFQQEQGSPKLKFESSQYKKSPSLFGGSSPQTEKQSQISQNLLSEDTELKKNTRRPSDLVVSQKDRLISAAKDKQQIQYNQNEIENENSSLITIKSLKDEKSESDQSFFFDFDNAANEAEELKIFEQRLKIIKQLKMSKLQKIDDNLVNSRISNLQALHRKEQIYQKYEQQKRQIQKNKKQFVFSLSKLKKCAIKCHKQILRSPEPGSKIRKSLSVGNTIIKQVIENIRLQQIQPSQQDQPQLIKYIFRRDGQIDIGNISKPLTTTPNLSLPSPNRHTESEQQLLQKNNNTEVLKQYSQEIQELIEKQLIDEFVTTAFLNEGIFKYFKPYVEQIYQFKKISDQDIINYMDQIRKYFPDEGFMLLRVNQKINPTTLQILRIIRDLQYQADQYQLIVPEDCFKRYRAGIELHYESINKMPGKSMAQIRQKIKNIDLSQRVLRLQEEKRQKNKKYRNFERDLRIMYMKSVFNCINEYLIQTKSANAFMNGRSSIGPGQLSLAIKQYNQTYTRRDYHFLIQQVSRKIKDTMNIKCSIPSFKNYHDIELFQKQVMRQIQAQSIQGQFKWVNYMDEVLEIWQDLSTSVTQTLLQEAIREIYTISSFQ